MLEAAFYGIMIIALGKPCLIVISPTPTNNPSRLPFRSRVEYESEPVIN